MKRSRAVVAGLLTLGLALSACEIEFEDLFTTKNLRESSDPAERAAGNAPDADKKDEEAKEAADLGLLTARPEKVAEAMKLRPRDARYPMRLHVLLWELGDTDGRLDAFDKAKGLIRANAPPDTPPAEISRLTLEAQLEAYDYVLKLERARANPIAGNIDRLTNRFCAVHQYYVDTTEVSRSTQFYDLALSAATNCS